MGIYGAWCPQAQDDAQIGNEMGDSIHVRKPKMDQHHGRRRYRHHTLTSGLRVLLVEDPHTQKSSYAMAVEVGSLEDPPDFQGLAHFCEHMVFLGSQKYPGEDEFSDKLAVYGGSNNAYTASDQTVYFAEVDDKGFEETFDIFAQFFIEPLFAPKMVDKEVNAVDSEHRKNMADASWRLIHLMKSQSNPQSPVSKFSTGNLETLKLEPEKAGKSLPKALQQFHQEHYCPSRMHLVIMRNASLEEQLQTVEKSFGVLRAGTCPPRPVYDHIPMFSRNLGNLGRRFNVPTDGAPQLWLMFPMPSLLGTYKAVPEAYINYALSHYGPGGLKALLKHEDLSLHYSTMLEATPAGTMLFLVFSLTSKGVAESDRIIDYAFAYFNAIKSHGVDQALIQKMQSLNQVMFDYQERSTSDSSVVTGLAGALPKVAPEDVLTGGALIDEVNLSLTRALLDAVHPRNMNVAWSVGSADERAQPGHLRHDRYYDFNYTEEPLKEELLQLWERAQGFGLEHPPSPAYVPEKLELIKEQRPTRTSPEKLEEAQGLQLWWLGLGGFKVPKAQVQMKLKFPRAVLSSPARAVLGALHVRLVNMALEEPSDAFQMCGVSYSLSSGSNGLSLTFSGFNEHLLALARLVLPRLSRAADSAAFEMARRQLILELQDVTSQQPYQHALEALEVVTVQHTFSRDTMLRAAQDEWAVSPTEHEAMLDEMFAEPELLVLVTGNIDQAQAKTFARESLQVLSAARHSGFWGPVAGLWDRFYSFLFGSGLAAPRSSKLEPLVLNLPKALEIRVANPIPQDVNSATVASYQFGVPSLSDRLRFSLISQIIDRPVFQTLRTEQQLGYVVFGFAAVHVDILEVRVLVQGFQESPDVVEGLIESTVYNLTHLFEEMSDDEFRQRKESLAVSLRTPPANLGELAGRVWPQIWDETYCFDKNAKELHLLEAISKPSLLEAWQEATGAKRLTVKLFGSLEPQVEGGGTGAAADFTPAFAMCGGRMMKPTGS
ncbi:Insulin-degrading enzyme (Insulin protease) (Insulinase) (Insulysin) [Durusdinium trenchii]|uniref:Insulin-degrading enzyme (Insulin protease) (Insulinase) (Insulysin) n=1 Tax=Durusdinium trenchii TaxID=1381693 RepID=A0ABP0Q3J7_9DINO